MSEKFRKTESRAEQLRRLSADEAIEALMREDVKYTAKEKGILVEQIVSDLESVQVFLINLNESGVDLNEIEQWLVDELRVRMNELAKGDDSDVVGFVTDEILLLFPEASS